MLTRRAALEIAKLFRFFDATCRHDLATHRIISERDYVSNLATHIRYPFGALCTNRLADHGRQLTNVWPCPGPRFISVTSAPNIEQVYGCDGIIIFSSDLGTRGTLHRVGMYEAKWPRLHPHTAAILNKWDDIGWRPLTRKKKPRPPQVFKSRFTNELLRQLPLARAGVVVWEQFFCQLEVLRQNLEFRRFGSTCVLHEQALAYLVAQPALWPSPEITGPKPRAAHPGLRAWNDVDLGNLLRHNSISFGYLIYLLLRPNTCGHYLRAVNNHLTVTNPFGNRPPSPATLAEEYAGDRRPPVDANDTTASAFLRVPVFASDAAAADNPLAITRFMRENGINNYLHVTIGEGLIEGEELDFFLKFATEHQLL